MERVTVVTNLEIKTRMNPKILGAALVPFTFALAANAALVTDPNDARNWQGATVGTFADLYYGSDTPANRQLVVDNQLLDDGIFNSAGYTAGTLVSAINTGGCVCYSQDSTGTGSFSYTAGGGLFSNANAIDEYWIQTSGTIGETVFDLGAPSEKAAIFNTIDHGPLPQEAIESSVFFSDSITGPWTPAVVERVWLEGFHPNLGIKWDGFVYAVGTGTADTFRYISIIHGGDASLQHDGDNEINGVLGLNGDFNPTVPESSTVAAGAVVLLMGLAGARLRRR